jgi:hypothetical protein
MKYLFLVILFFGPYAGSTQKSKLSTTVDRKSILIGEPFQLTLKAFVSGNASQWPFIDSIPHFEVLTKAKIDSQRNNGTLVLNQVITLTSWDSGRWLIPSYTFEGSGKSKPLLINVAFSPFDTTQDYHDVRDIMEGSKGERPQWYWYLAGALLLALLFILLFPTRKTKTAAAPFKTDTDIYKQSLAKLDSLKNETSKEAKVLHTELIEIFRVYLYKRKDIQSASKTTEDLARQLLPLQLPKPLYASLVQTLSLSDLVKFAQWQPDNQENSTSIETIKQSIIAIEELK